MTWSSFTATYNATKAPASIKAAIRREGVARFQARVQAGYADEALDFTDLVNQLLDAEAGR